MVGIRSRELCQAPISASVIITLAGVVGESLSFSTLQIMQRWLRPDSNAGHSRVPRPLVLNAKRA